MRGLVLTSCLATSFALVGCGVEPSSAAGASLQVAPKAKAEPVKPITPIDPVLREQKAKTFALDHEAGTIRFGDGEHGKRLPSTAASTETYRAGQGATGQTRQRAVTAKDFAEVAPSEPGVAVHRVHVAETPSTDDAEP